MGWFDVSRGHYFIEVVGEKAEEYVRILEAIWEFEAVARFPCPHCDQTSTGWGGMEGAIVALTIARGEPGFNDSYVNRIKERARIIEPPFTLRLPHFSRD